MEYRKAGIVKILRHFFHTSSFHYANKKELKN